jgi:hypothetical protein
MPGCFEEMKRQADIPLLYIKVWESTAHPGFRNTGQSSLATSQMLDKRSDYMMSECEVVHVMHACDDRLKGAASCLSWRVHSNGASKHDQIVHENKVCQQAVDSLLVLTSV